MYDVISDALAFAKRPMMARSVAQQGAFACEWLMDDGTGCDETAGILARLASLDAERVKLEAALGELQRRSMPAAPARPRETPGKASPRVTATSSTTDKVALFRQLFAGRPDIFPVRWENQKTRRAGYAPACANEWAKGLCGKPQVKCGVCPHQAFLPVSDEMIDRHLRGGDSSRSADNFVAGVYPLLPDETCWFLAADFDKDNWAADATAMIDTCDDKGIPAALERSRSGNGGHSGSSSPNH